MPIKNPGQGAAWTDAYRVSGIPFVSASTISRNDIMEIRLPYVSRFFSLTNRSTDTTELAFGFSLSGTMSSSSGLGVHHFIVGGGETFTTEIRTKQLFLSNSIGDANGEIRFNFLAGLTLIDETQFPLYTGSDASGNSAFKGVG